MNISELKNKTILLEEYNEYITFQKECVIPNKASAIYLMQIVQQDGTKDFIKGLAEKAIHTGDAALTTDNSETDKVKLKLINELPTFEEWLKIKNTGPEYVFK